MTTRMRRNVVPYLGHILIGTGVGLLTGAVIVAFLAANTMHLDPDLFFTYTVWTLSLLVGGILTTAVGLGVYMTPYDRKQWAARHAVRHARGR